MLLINYIRPKDLHKLLQKKQFNLNNLQDFCLVAISENEDEIKNILKSLGVDGL